MNVQPYATLTAILIALLAVSMVLVFVRLFRGPDTPNRIISFDLIAIHAVAVLALYAMFTGARALLDAAIITAVLGFVGTTMLSFFLERSAEEGEQESSDERGKQP